MSKIEWCDETINPIVGCSKVSPACNNCYAEGMARRLQAMGTRGYEDVVDEKGKWTGKLNFIGSELEKPKKWKKPKRIFVGSMTDLFHENVNFEWIDKIIGMVKDNPIHTFIFLTKRAERMNEYFADRSEYLEFMKVRNIWLGVTAENQEQANVRIPILLDTPAVKRFVSIEPMLGEIKLTMLGYPEFEYDSLFGGHMSVPKEETHENWEHRSGKNVSLDWVICGGESGKNARPLHPDWVKNLKKQCEDSKVPFFFKQWGEFAHNDFNGELLPDRVGKKRAGKLIDGREYLSFPSAEV